jgi:hypothetical protein
LYLSQKIKRPSSTFPTATDELSYNDKLQLTMVPNPSNSFGSAHLLVDAPEKLDYLNVRIFDIHGKLLEQLKTNNLTSDLNILEMPTMKKGFYIVECQSNIGKRSIKWVVVE